MNLRSLYHTSDLDIINTLRKGGKENIKAEEKLFNSYAYFIKEGIYKYSVTEDEAFDAYADTILSGLERIRNGSFQHRSSLKTWLFQIFHNKIVDFLRKKTTNRYSVHRSAELDEQKLQISDTVKPIIEKLIEKTDFDKLKEKLAQVGADCRKMLEQWADGFSDKEIALSMNYKTADVAKTSRLRCLEKLRRLYGEPPQ